MSIVTPRPVADVDQAIDTVRIRRRAKVAARDRRTADAHRALRDVEDYNRQIAADTISLDDLIDERLLAAAAQQRATATR